MYSAKIGDDVSVVLDRNGKDILINTTLTQAYTTITDIVEEKNATQAQIDLRKAWLNNASNSEASGEKSKP